MLITHIVEKLTDLEPLFNNKKIILFGTGKSGRKVLAGLRILSLEVDYLLDNNPYFIKYKN